MKKPMAARNEKFSGSAQLAAIRFGDKLMGLDQSIFKGSGGFFLLPFNLRIYKFTTSQVVN